MARMKELSSDPYLSPEELDYPVVEQRNLGQRRWGFDEQTVLDVDGEFVGVLRYVVTGDGDSDGPDAWGVYEVEPVVTTTYRKKK